MPLDIGWTQPREERLTMKLTILTEFTPPLFDAYDIAELEVSLAVVQHSAKTLRFRVMLDIKNRWDYEGESDIEVPDEVYLVDPDDTSYDIAGSGGFERTYRLELKQNFLDGLKDFACEPLWVDELHYELYVECILEDGDTETRESTTLDIKNPWHPRHASA